MEVETSAAARVARYVYEHGRARFQGPGHESGTPALAAMADPFFYLGQDSADEKYLMSLGLVLPPEPPAGSAFEAY